MWTIRIPNWCPPSVNVGRGRHFSKSHKATAEVCEYLTAYNATAGARKVGGDYRPVRRLSLFVQKIGTLPDPDNLLKHTLDGAKLARLIVDDKAKWCHWTRPVVTNPPPGSKKEETVLELEDVIPGPVAAGPVFTRASVVVRPWHHPHQQTLSRGDFFLYFDCAGFEEVWTMFPNCGEAHLARLVSWAESLGLAVERVAWNKGETPAPARGRAGKPELADPALL